MDNAQLETISDKSATPSASSVWRTVKSFILWSHERGSVQYDVMVTLILLFVLLSPRFINFNDRPVEHNPQSSGVLVYPDGSGEFIYQIESKAVSDGSDSTIRASLLKIIEPISGSVSISKYETVTDKKGKVVAYKVWVQRE